MPVDEPESAYRLVARYGDDLGRVTEAGPQREFVRLWPTRDRAWCMVTRAVDGGARGRLRLHAIDTETGAVEPLFTWERKRRRAEDGDGAPEDFTVHEDGRWCAVCVGDGLEVFDRSTRTSSRVVLRPAPRRVWAAPDGSDRVFVPQEGQLRRVDLKTGAHDFALKGARLVGSSSDGSTLVVFVRNDGAAHELAVCDLTRGTTRTLRANVHQPRADLHVSRDGSALWCVYRDPRRRDLEVEVLSLTTGQRIYWGSLSGSHSLLTPVDERRAWFYDSLSGGVLFDAATGSREVVEVQHRGHPTEGVTLSNDGRELYFTDRGRLCITSLESGVTRSFHRFHRGAVTGVARSPDGSLLATASHDAVIHVWKAASGEHVWALEGHTRAVNEVTFSPDGRSLWSCAYEEPAIEWDLRTGMARTRDGEAPRWHGATIAPDTTRVAARLDPSSDPQRCDLALVDLDTLRRVAALHIAPEESPSRCVACAFSDDAREALVCEDPPDVPGQSDPAPVVRRFRVEIDGVEPVGQVTLERVKPTAPHYNGYGVCGFLQHAKFAFARGSCQVALHWKLWEPDLQLVDDEPRRAPWHLIEVHDALTGRVTSRFPAFEDWARSLGLFDEQACAWDFDGERLAISTSGGRVRVLALPAGDVLAEVSLRDEGISLVRLDDGGRTLLVGTCSGWLLRYRAA